MATRFVHLVAATLGRKGWRAVRVDVRGVGRSGGGFDDGRGEVEDAVVAWDALREESGAAPMVVGFSFGAALALRVCVLRPAPKAVLVAPPLDPLAVHLDPRKDATLVACPATVIAGSADDVAPVDGAREIVKALPRGRLVELAGADHLLMPTHHTAAVQAVVDALGDP